LFDKLSNYQLFKEYPAPWNQYVKYILIFIFLERSPEEYRL